MARKCMLILINRQDVILVILNPVSNIRLKGMSGAALSFASESESVTNCSVFSVDLHSVR